MDPDRPGILYSEDDRIATFLLYNLSGQIVGYQQYNPAGTKSIRNDERHRDELKYFTFIGAEGGTKKTGVWGIETVGMDDPIVFLTEGVFDAVKIQNLGLPALAVLANDPHHLRPFFMALGRRLVAVADRDAAGSKLAKFADVSLVVPEPWHDLGDMPQGEVESWLRQNSMLR